MEKNRKSYWRVSLAFCLCSGGAFLGILSFATAHTVGGQCPSAQENCEKWAMTVQGPALPAGQRPDEFPSAIAINSTTVFVGLYAVAFNTSDAYSSTSSWTLAAYDLNTGAERWRVFRRSRVYDSLHDIAVSPDGSTVVATGGAYDAFPVGATDSRIVTVAYDSATGAERWSATWDNSPTGTDNSAVVAFSPDGHSVYVGGITMPTPGELDYVTIAYDATNGTQQWVSIYKGLGAGGTNSLFDLAVSPDGKRVFVTGESAGAREYELDYATVAYDALTGSELWVSRSEPTFVDRACCLAVDNDHVYVTGDSYTGPNGGDYQALNVALRASDGSVAWQQRLGGSGYNGARAITAGGGRVVVTTQSPSTGPGEGLTALTATYDATTGNQLWVTSLAEPLRSQLANDVALAPDGSHVYLIASSRPNIPDTGLDDQEVIAYNLNDGSIDWSVHLDSGPANALTGNNVTVTSDGSSLITLGQITRSADPTGATDQNIYDSAVVALPATFSPASTPTPTPGPAVPVTSVVSRMCHSSAGLFDVDLPLAGKSGIESRAPGNVSCIANAPANADYALVFNFLNPLVSVGGVTITCGSATTSGTAAGQANYNVFLSGASACNGQYVTVTLTNVLDSQGKTGDVPITFGLLLGDVNASGRVDAADVSAIRQQTLQPIDFSNVRADITASGRIDAADVSIARQQTLTSLP
jgi:hypothetical protein